MMLPKFLLLATVYLVWGVVFHIFADWILQNERMAKRKVSLRNWEGYLHAGIHFVCLCVVFSPWLALILAFIHLLVDTRIPLEWWKRVYRQTTEGPFAIHVQIWEDQVVHVLCIAIAALVQARLR